MKKRRKLERETAAKNYEEKVKEKAMLDSAKCSGQDLECLEVEPQPGTSKDSDLDYQPKLGKKPAKEHIFADPKVSGMGIQQAKGIAKYTYILTVHIPKTIYTLQYT